MLMRMPYREPPRPTRRALALALPLLLLLPAIAAAQTLGGAAPPPKRAETAAMAAEPLSRAQVLQMIADRGYFETNDLTQAPDGSWHCTALAGPGQRVALTLDKNGTIIENDLPAKGRP